MRFQVLTLHLSAKGNRYRLKWSFSRSSRSSSFSTEDLRLALLLYVAALDALHHYLGYHANSADPAYSRLEQIIRPPAFVRLTLAVNQLTAHD